MFRNMVTSLFKHERIRTTDTKAKALREWADHLVTLAKRGDLHALRQALAIVREKKVVYKLFAEAQERYGSVSGGYTRIVKLGRRPGDAAPISLIELIAPEKGKSPAKKTVKKESLIAGKQEAAAEKQETGTETDSAVQAEPAAAEGLAQKSEPAAAEGLAQKSEAAAADESAADTETEEKAADVSKADTDRTAS
jgi:large subunit ribosomal protein L17